MTPNIETLFMHGYKFVARDILVDIKYREVERSLKERLFTFPWRPFKKTRTESYTVPKQEVVIDDIHRIIYAHPEVLAKLTKKIEQFVQPVVWKNPFANEFKMKYNDWFKDREHGNEEHSEIMREILGNTDY